MSTSEHTRAMTIIDGLLHRPHFGEQTAALEELRRLFNRYEALLNDALEQLRHEEHLRTTAELRVGELEGK